MIGHACPLSLFPQEGSKLQRAATPESCRPGAPRWQNGACCVGTSGFQTELPPGIGINDVHRWGA